MKANINVMQKKCTPQLVKYEIRNIMGNLFTAFFGIVFPTLMLFIITKAVSMEVPEAMVPEANTSVFITMSMIIPMAVILLGYAAVYSQELEKDIPVRMKLFGFPERSIMCAKIIAQIIVLTAGLVFYTLIAYAALDMQAPRFSSACCLIFCLYLLSVIFFILAHGIAGIFRKFGPTYGIVMGIYFATMILCGMMGIRPEQLPDPLQKIAAVLPMSYIGSDFIEFWQKGSYNFAPLIQSYLFFGAISGMILMYANYKNRRVIR